MADSDVDLCNTCGHERLYHQGSGSFFNTTGCSVSYCKCKSFVKKND